MCANCVQLDLHGTCILGYVNNRKFASCIIYSLHKFSTFLLCHFSFCNKRNIENQELLNKLCSSLNSSPLYLLNYYSPIHLYCPYNIPYRHSLPFPILVAMKNILLLILLLEQMFLVSILENGEDSCL